MTAADSQHYAGGLPLRTHGVPSEAGPVVVLHGGPAAAGSAYGLAESIADRVEVLEPWQRAGDARPITVARLRDDLLVLLDERRLPSAALVGHSWGAMLALAFAAAYPARASRIVLVGCGTFDAASRTELKRELARRTSTEQVEALASIESSECDPVARIKRRHEIIESLYDFEPTAPSDPYDLDPRAHDEAWRDMLRLQADGTYPRAFAAIHAPVLMLHGAHDPHPGPLIARSLRPHLPQLEYRELARCGHSPWRERWARARFIEQMVSFLKLPAR